MFWTLAACYISALVIVRLPPDRPRPSDIGSTQRLCVPGMDANQVAIGQWQYGVVETR